MVGEPIQCQKGSAKIGRAQNHKLDCLRTDCKDKTKLGFSRRSISNVSIHLTPRSMHTSGSLMTSLMFRADRSSVTMVQS